MTFDSQILLPKNDKDKYKLIYSIENQKKRISRKILKLDENNQYGNAMTKPLPYDCIKKASKIPSFLEFNKILDSISDTDKIGHLFIADIKFHNKNEKTMLFNEIYTPIFEKNKVIQAHQRSVPQLMLIINRDEKRDLVRSFKVNAKIHSTLEEKNSFPSMRSIFTF